MGTHRRCCPAEAAPTCGTTHRTHGVARPVREVGRRVGAPRAVQRSVGVIRCLRRCYGQRQTKAYRTAVAPTVVDLERMGLAGLLWPSPLPILFPCPWQLVPQEAGAPRRAL